MYITGSKSSFESRLHQLPTTSGDLNSFALEGSGYVGVGTPNPSLYGKWNHEFGKRYYVLFKNSSFLTGDKVSFSSVVNAPVDADWNLVWNGVSGASLTINNARGHTHGQLQGREEGSSLYQGAITTLANATVNIGTDNTSFVQVYLRWGNNASIDASWSTFSAEKDAGPP